MVNIKIESLLEELKEDGHKIFVMSETCSVCHFIKHELDANPGKMEDLEIYTFKADDVPIYTENEYLKNWLRVPFFIRTSSTAEPVIEAVDYYSQLEALYKA